MSAHEKREYSKNKALRELFSYVKTILIYMLVTWFICSKIVTHAQVPTGSMENTVEAGSRVIVNRVAYLLDKPERGDIVTFKMLDDESKIYLKRVIGLPGETIEGRDGKIYINGEELPEPYIKELCTIEFGPYTIPNECYFMMGDNRNDSWDSRFWEHHYVSEDAIEGKVSIEIYPSIKFLK